MGIFDKKAELPKPFQTHSLTTLLQQFDLAIKAITDADTYIKNIWELEPSMRTNRLAEVGSLLERAKRKLQLDSEKHQRQTT